MFACQDSKYLDRDRLSERGTNYSELIGSLTQVEGSIKILEGYNETISTRRHNEPYLWRIMIFDQTAYFHPYIFKSENDENDAPIFKFKHSENSLYNTLYLYFKDVWDKNSTELNPSNSRNKLLVKRKRKSS